MKKPNKFETLIMVINLYNNPPEMRNLIIFMLSLLLLKNSIIGSFDGWIAFAFLLGSLVAMLFEILNWRIKNRDYMVEALDELQEEIDAEKLELRKDFIRRYGIKRQKLGPKD